MIKLLVTAAIILAMTQVTAFAQASHLGATIPPPPPVVAPPSGPSAPGPALAPIVPALPRTVVIPGSAVPGTVYDNGNGTSTVVVPGGASQVIPTPR